MNKEAFLKVVNNVKEISDDDMENLLESSKFYPYCQNIHILIAKKYHDLQHGLAPAKLHKAAIYSPDRLFLKRVMEDDPSIKKFTRPSPAITEIDQGQDTQNSDKIESKEENILVENFQYTGPEEENKEISAVSEEIEKVEKEEELNAVNSTNEAPYSSINNLTPEPEKVNNELVDTKEDIHAELERNIREYKEKRLQETKQSEESIEAVNSEEPEITENSTSIESTSVNEDTRNTEVSDIKEPSTISIKKEDQSSLSGIESEVDVKSETSVDQHQLIENFIKLNPSLSRFDLKFDEDQKQLEDLSIPKLTIGEHLISENLAVILHKQGKVQKAINIYEKLILKFPEKKAYFASCIEKIKNPS